MTEGGATIGVSNRALFRNSYLKGFCHGDDFIGLGTRKNLEDFGKLLEKHFDVRLEAIIGFGSSPGGAQLGKVMHVLNRTVTINDEQYRIELEPDRKHVELLIKELGLQQAHAAPTPRAKLSETDSAARDSSPFLQGDDIKLFRSGTMRCKYLDQDRLDIAEAVHGEAT